jgi:hypothetical protein
MPGDAIWVVTTVPSSQALILRCEPKASLEGRNPVDTAPHRRCVLRGSLRSHLSMMRSVGLANDIHVYSQAASAAAGFAVVTWTSTDMPSSSAASP